MNRRDPTSPSARSPERQRLAAAIERHAEATVNAERVSTAQRRAEDAFFDTLTPAVAAARQALEDARAAQPQALVAAALGEPAPDAPSVADAEKTLADAERKLTDGRQARSMLADEVQRSQAAVNSATINLDAALSAAVAADPAVDVLKAEFFAAGRRMLRCAQILRTAGVNLRGLTASGLSAHIGDAAVAVGQRAFWPDLTMLAAMAALREDPDYALPADVPPDDPDDAGDGHSSRAAAA